MNLQAGEGQLGNLSLQSLEPSCLGWRELGTNFMYLLLQIDPGPDTLN